MRIGKKHPSHDAVLGLPDLPGVKDFRLHNLDNALQILGAKAQTLCATDLRCINHPNGETENLSHEAENGHGTALDLVSARWNGSRGQVRPDTGQKSNKT